MPLQGLIEELATVIQLEPENGCVVVGHQCDVKDNTRESPRQRAKNQLRNDRMNTADMQVIRKATQIAKSLRSDIIYNQYEVESDLMAELVLVKTNLWGRCFYYQEAHPYLIHKACL